MCISDVIEQCAKHIGPENRETSASSDSNEFENTKGFRSLYDLLIRRDAKIVLEQNIDLSFHVKHDF